MVVSLASSSLLSNLLLHLVTLHKCKIAIHIPIGNRTQLDDTFVHEVLYNLPVSTLVQDLSIDSSYETSVFGKACFTSFSKSALEQVQYIYRQKRHVKILLGDVYNTPYPKPDYEPVIVENPPVISLTESLLSSGKQPHLKAL